MLLGTGGHQSHFFSLGTSSTTSSSPNPPPSAGQTAAEVVKLTLFPNGKDDVGCQHNIPYEHPKPLAREPSRAFRRAMMSPILSL